MRKILLLILLAFASQALAHKPSDSYLQLSPAEDGFTGEWRIALRDLDAAIGLDADGDRRVTWRELRARHGEIAAYALSRLEVKAASSTCRIIAGAQLVDDLSDGAYTVLPLHAICPRAAALPTLRYDLLFDIDPTHRGLLTLTGAGKPQTFVLSPAQQVAVLSDAKPDAWRQFTGMLREGVWHIWIGYDHILFLLALLLSAGLRPTGDASSHWQALLKDVLKLVTAFTVAHSITLSLAALRIVSLPPRLIETAIAISIVVAGLRLLRPQAHSAPWIAAAFGLVHGFGFANVLADMQLPSGSLALSLFAFNVGVELGQCAIVAAALPLIAWLQRGGFYRRVLIPVAAVLIAVIGLAWSIERGADIDLMQTARSAMRSS
jgi:hypothetical protein